MTAQDNTPDLKVYESAQSASQAAARDLAIDIASAIRARGQCSVAFSGGRSPRALLAALAREDVAWDAVHIFQVDERCAPAGSAARNATELQTDLLNRITIPVDNVHLMPVNEANLLAAAEHYAATLREVAGTPPVLDIVHLGLGGDGHTASLAPGDPVLSETCMDVAVTGNYQDHKRLTLTFPCLQRARRIIWLATGAEKSPMLKRLLRNDAGIPAGRIGHDRAVVYADRGAAADAAPGNAPMVLAIDIGGSHVKFMCSQQGEQREFTSGPHLSAQLMCDQVRSLTTDWAYEAVSIGIPGPVQNNQPRANPPNLGSGWVGFDFYRAFERPLKIVNDAAMQALGSYRGGTMLFLGLGTGLGSTLVAHDLLLGMELAHLPYRKKLTYEDYVGERGLERLGENKWRKHVQRVVEIFQRAFLTDEVVLGGGNVRLLDTIPTGCRRGDNADAFSGGFRLWESRYSRGPAQHFLTARIGDGERGETKVSV